MKSLNEYIEKLTLEAKKINKYFSKYLFYMNGISISVDDQGKASIEPGTTIFATDWIVSLVKARDSLDAHFNDTITLLAWLDKYSLKD